MISVMNNGKPKELHIELRATLFEIHVNKSSSNEKSLQIQ